MKTRIVLVAMVVGLSGCGTSQEEASPPESIAAIEESPTTVASLGTTTTEPVTTTTTVAAAPACETLQEIADLAEAYSGTLDDPAQLESFLDESVALRSFLPDQMEPPADLNAELAVAYYETVSGLAAGSGGDAGAIAQALDTLPLGSQVAGERSIKSYALTRCSIEIVAVELISDVSL